MHTDIERIAQTLTRTWRLGLADERPVQVRAMRSFPVRAFALPRARLGALRGPPATRSIDFRMREANGNAVR